MVKPIKIPRNIFQTWSTKNISADLKKITETWTIKNPNYAYFLYDDNLFIVVFTTCAPNLVLFHKTNHHSLHHYESSHEVHFVLQNHAF